MIMQPARQSDLAHGGALMRTDDQLLAAIALEDESALRELYARYAPSVAALVRLHHQENVEDALQAVFLDLWRSAPCFRHAQVPATTWIIGMARRALLRSLPATRVFLEG